MKFQDILAFFGHRDWFDFEMIRLASGEAAECVHTEVYRWRRTGKLIELRRGLFVLAEPWRRKPVDGADLAGAIYPPSYLSGRWALSYWGLLPQAPGLDYSSVSARPARVFKNSFGTYSYSTLPRDLLFGTTAFLKGEVVTQKKVPPPASSVPGAPQTQPTELPTTLSLEVLLSRASYSRIALPEKALLDLCFMEGGEWDAARLVGLGLKLNKQERGLEIGIQSCAASTDTLAAEFLPNEAETPSIDIEKFASMAERSGRPRLIKAAKALARLACGSGIGQAEIENPKAVTPELPWSEESL